MGDVSVGKEDGRYDGYLEIEEVLAKRSRPALLFTGIAILLLLGWLIYINRDVLEHVFN